MLTEAPLSTLRMYKSVSGNWSRYLNKQLNNQNRKADGLTLAQLMDLLEAQQYRCALSGVLMTCKLDRGIRYPTNVSFDRIEAGGPYTIDNIQLVCSAVNSFRGNLTVPEFIGWCNKVTSHNV